MESFASFLFFLSFATYLTLGGVHLGAGIVGVFGDSTTRAIVGSTRRAGWELAQFSLLGLCGLLYFSFPGVFAVLSGPLVIPFMALLIFALLSGLSLVLSRHRITSLVLFRISAFGVPSALGLVVGAMVMGRIDVFSLGVYGYYFRPWLNTFCFTLSLFLVSFFWFLGANFFSPMLESLRKTAVGLSGVALSFGSLVFVVGELYGLELFASLFSRPVAFIPFLALGVIWVGFSVWVHRDDGQHWVRWLGAGAAGALTLGWEGLFFPVIVRLEGPEAITFESMQGGALGPALAVMGLLLSLFALRPLVKVS